MYKRKRIKIVFMIDWLPSARAGTERQLLYIINGLDKELFDVHLVCLHNTEWLSENRNKLPCRTYSIDIYKFKNIKTYVNILKLMILIRNINPDIVHTLFPISNVIGVIISNICKVKVILSSRRDYGQWITPIFLALTFIANKFLTRITTNSENVKLFTRQKEHVDLNKIDVLRNGVDLDRFSFNKKKNNIIKSTLGIPQDNFVIGIVANLRPMKHLDTFIYAAEKVLKSREDVNFIMVGQGPSKKEIETLIDKNQIKENVLLVGSTDDVILYLRIFDIAVNCSAQEGLSNAIMEYMAAGLPCIVSDAGGNNELIEDDINGMVFKLDDYNELATKILRLLSNDDLRQTFGRKAREKVHNQLSLRSMIENYEKYYTSLVK